MLYNKLKRHPPQKKSLNQKLTCKTVTITMQFLYKVCQSSADKRPRIFAWTSRFKNFFYRATLCQRGICYGPVSVCLSVCLSVRSRCYTKTAKHRITQTTRQYSRGNLVRLSNDKDLSKSSPGSLPAGGQMQVR